ncbi:hypothetical protein, partial [Amphibacillus xylanus]|uniref:Transposase n=1 Tax=Amphibacillus xylanus (strain ATCC 51415 / DSM 6626 / JCM 7361 / LMG 17667 / NBRC 15112 / Ep01) TaxID=698758 RepID=K0J6Z6_AMPXN
MLLSEAIFNDKVLRYQENGLEGIQTKLRNNYYSKEFKDLIVREHIQKGIPIIQLARKYKIPA